MLSHIFNQFWAQSETTSVSYYNYNYLKKKINHLFCLSDWKLKTEVHWCDWRLAISPYLKVNGPHPNANFVRVLFMLSTSTAFHCHFRNLKLCDDWWFDKNTQKKWVSCKNHHKHAQNVTSTISFECSGTVENSYFSFTFSNFIYTYMQSEDTYTT